MLRLLLAYKKSTFWNGLWALRAAARAEGDEQGEDEHDHWVFIAISSRRATSKLGENNSASGFFTIKSEDQEVDVSNAQDQYKSIMMKFEAADIGMEMIAFGTNRNFNSSTTWATQLRDTRNHRIRLKCYHIGHNYPVYRKGAGGLCHFNRYRDPRGNN